MATYIIPDTHGCLVTLRFLLEEKLQFSKADILYLLGDYIDRGPLSAHLVEYLISLKENGYSINAIRGNHEQMILDSINSKVDLRLWLFNSGDLTIKSYKELIGDFFEFPNDIPNSHMYFYSKLPYYMEVDRFILIHGGINYKAENPMQDKTAMLWNRPESVPHNFMPDRVIIHGHTPTSLGIIQETVQNPKSRLIPLDAGCVYAGRNPDIGYLVALELEKMQLHWVEKMD